jgi:hypothetical protein
LRSEKFHLALSHGNSRFEMCNMIAKGMRATHVNGTRMADTINKVMVVMDPKPVVRVPPIVR